MRNDATMRDHTNVSALTTSLAPWPAYRTRSNARAWHAVTFAIALFAVILQLVLVIQGGQHLNSETDLDVNEHGYGAVLGTGVGIGVAMAALGWLAYWLERRLPTSEYDARTRLPARG
jgi:hypothetical protein